MKLLPESRQAPQTPSPSPEAYLLLSHLLLEQSLALDPQLVHQQQSDPLLCSSASVVLLKADTELQNWPNPSGSFKKLESTLLLRHRGGVDTNVDTG